MNVHNYKPANERALTLERVKEELSTWGANPDERSLPMTVAIWLNDDQHEPIMGVVTDIEVDSGSPYGSQVLLQVQSDVRGMREREL